MTNDSLPCFLQCPHQALVTGLEQTALSSLKVHVRKAIHDASAGATKIVS